MKIRLYDGEEATHYLLGGRIVKPPVIDTVGSKGTRRLKVGVVSSYTEGLIYVTAFGDALADLEHVEGSDTVVLEFTEKVAVRDDGQPIMTKNGEICYNRTVENVFLVTRSGGQAVQAQCTETSDGIPPTVSSAQDTFGTFSSDDLPFK